MEKNYGPGYMPNAALGIGTPEDWQRASRMQNSIGTSPPVSPIDERLATVNKLICSALREAGHTEERFQRVLGSATNEAMTPPSEVTADKMHLCDQLEKFIRDLTKLNSHLQSINSRCQL